MSDWWRNDDLWRQDISRELPPGVEAFESPHLLLLHTVLVYHRTLASTGWHPRVLIFRLGRVPYLDRRGTQVVATLAQLCRERRVLLLLSEVRPDTWGALGRKGLLDEVGPGNVFARWNEALERAREYLGLG